MTSARPSIWLAAAVMAALAGCDGEADDRARSDASGKPAAAEAAKGGATMSETKGGTAVKVRVSAQDPAEMERIADALQRSGLSVRQRLPELGLITGDIDPTRVSGLMAIDGVSAVEPEGSVRLPPLDPEKPQ